MSTNLPEDIHGRIVNTTPHLAEPTVLEETDDKTDPAAATGPMGNARAAAHLRICYSQLADVCSHLLELLHRQAWPNDDRMAAAKHASGIHQVIQNCYQRLDAREPLPDTTSTRALRRALERETEHID